MVSDKAMETMAFLGCSRGLGRAVFQELQKRNLDFKALLVARNEASLKNLAGDRKNALIFPCDLSRPENLPLLQNWLFTHKPQRVFYFAGGGAHGPFQSKAWKDHLWGLQVSFLSPAELLRGWMNQQWEGLQQVVMVGSLVADHQADPQASSYAAAKHGLKGLLTSILAEGPCFDLRLFRPGYMDTDLLPKQARPRAEGDPILSIDLAAQKFVDWVIDPSAPAIYDLSP